MDIKSNTSLTAPSLDCIESFEKAYRVKLPRDYLQFLESGNGGTPIQNTFEVNDRERVVEFFLCLLENPGRDPGGWRDITVVASQLDERLSDDENLVGMNVVPIAALFAGDFICLDFRDDPDSPTVAVWDHERSDVFAPFLEVVADSFSAFLTMLRTCP